MVGVKVLWFHLMPYPQLPEDFRERYRSVWVDLDAGLLQLGDGEVSVLVITDHGEELRGDSQVRQGRS